MPRETTNYNFQKPLYTENADIAVINEDLDNIDAALTPTVSAVNAPSSSASGGKLAVVLGWIANRIKAITGLSSWQSNPPVTLSECKNHIQGGTHANASSSTSGFMSAADKAKLDNATSEKTASRLVIRDSNGRAKISTPSDSNDIANKTYVDSNFVRKNADTTMTAKLTAYSNTAYTTKQVRNIVFWTSGTTPPSTSNGDVVIKTF